MFNRHIQTLKFTAIRPRRARRAGFTFTEILFAMMILGIGIIMVSAMFPVPIMETQEMVQETTGASVAKSGASYIARIGNYIYTPAIPGTSPAYNTTYFPLTNGVTVAAMLQMNGATQTAPAVQLNYGFATVPSFWHALNGNMVLPSDTRYAWVPFYSRNTVNGVLSSNAQVTVIAVQCRNKANFTTADLTPISPYPPNLQGRPLVATFVSGGANPDAITFYPDGYKGTFPQTAPFPPAAPDLTGAVGPGAFVVVANDSMTPNASATPRTTCNGFVYRVGNPYVQANGTVLTNPNGGITYELMPGNDMKNSLFCPTTAYSSLTPAVVASTQPVYNPTGLTAGDPAWSQPVRVFVVGRGYADPASGNTAFAGSPMDIAAFSTFIKVQ